MVHKPLFLALLALAAVFAGVTPARAEDGGPDDAPGPDAVPASDAGGAASCGDLLIVLDRSGSMAICVVNGESKESMARDAIKSVADKFKTLPLGLAVFPDTLTDCSAAAACNAGKVVLDVSVDGSMGVGPWLDKMPKSCGGTPTGDTLAGIKDYDRWTPGRRHFVLLITDGMPTCQDGFTDGSMSIPCDGKGSIECKNPTKVFDSIAYLKGRGIDTFVVGFDAKFCGGTMLNPDTLNKMAELGGEPLSGARKYYEANTKDEILKALDEIGGKVAGGTVGGCTRPPSASKDGGSGGTGGGEGGGGGGGQSGGGGQAGAGGGPAAHGSPGCACRAMPRGGVASALAAALLGLASKRRRN